MMMNTTLLSDAASRVLRARGQVLSGSTIARLRRHARVLRTCRGGRPLDRTAGAARGHTTFTADRANELTYAVLHTRRRAAIPSPLHAPRAPSRQAGAERSSWQLAQGAPCDIERESTSSRRAGREGLQSSGCSKRGASTHPPSPHLERQLPSCAVPTCTTPAPARNVEARIARAQSSHRVDLAAPTPPSRTRWALDVRGSKNSRGAARASSRVFQSRVLLAPSAPNPSPPDSASASEARGPEISGRGAQTQPCTPTTSRRPPRHRERVPRPSQPRPKPASPIPAPHVPRLLDSTKVERAHPLCSRRARLTRARPGPRIGVRAEFASLSAWNPLRSDLRVEREHAPRFQCISRGAGAGLRVRRREQDAGPDTSAGASVRWCGGFLGIRTSIHPPRIISDANDAATGTTVTLHLFLSHHDHNYHFPLPRSTTSTTSPPPTRTRSIHPTLP
ncbi:hypothetical protein DFH09DRAFT_1312227 [Mycena vulgaris]|nr:hypothetical protein DFH09DRAFT_1312227 [Mycena vulgaris]